MQRGSRLPETSTVGVYHYYMLTVPEASRRVNRDPETIRRWIRAGKLRAQRVGTQHLVDEADLDAAAGAGHPTLLPEPWQHTWTGEPPVDWADVVRHSRGGH